MPFKIPKRLSIVERLLVALTVLTITTMAWQHWGMNRSLVIAPGSGHKVWALGDDVDKGGSVASFREENNAYVMRCHIKNILQFPYCSLYIQLGRTHKGIDLTAYQYLLITVKRSSTVPDSISLYLKDLKSEIDIAALANQTSVNQSALNPSETFTEYSLPLNRFYVPAWWVFHSRLPYETPGPNLTHINYLVINTGDNNKERDLEISISRIEFKGKWIAATDLYKALLMVWISVFGSFYLALFIKLQLQSNEEKLNRKEQEEINQALDSKRKQLESIAIYDSGTGLLNRRGIIDRLYESFNAAPQHEMCNLVLISIDNYKTIESKLKEDCMDELATYVALQFSGYMAQKITLSRWGKNEILALIEISDIQAAMTKMQQLINDSRIMKFRDLQPIHISIGVVVTTPQPVESVIALIEQAALGAKHSSEKIHLITHPA